MEIFCHGIYSKSRICAQLLKDVFNNMSDLITPVSSQYEIKKEAGNKDINFNTQRIMHKVM